MLYLIRHGQTAKNKEMLLQGRSDLPLIETGILQAQEAARRFHELGIRFDVVYCSPLRRARETAGLLLAGTVGEGEMPPVLTDERLLEIDYGPYEGLGLRSLPPAVLTFFEDFVNNPAPEGMEPLPSVVRRAGAFLEEIREEAEQKNVLLSIHAIIMKGALEYLTPDSKGGYWYSFLGNCEAYAAEVRDGVYSVPERLFRGVSDAEAKARWEERGREQGS
jgi:broad specificity phosphatase PhoE